jgi:hypothetical protein
MIDETKILKKMSKIIRDSDIKAISDVLIERYDNGVYHLFEKYQIKKIKGVYVIDCLTHADELYFYALKNAVAWCIFDKQVNVSTAKRILVLDKGLVGADSNIQLHRTLVRKTKKTEDKLVYLAKMGEEKLKREHMATELAGYLEESKRWQMKKFGTKK